jgi:hypothetical protein
MLCVCERPCQKQIDDYIMTFEKGAIHAFDECPKFFRPLEGKDAEPVDFDNAGEDELLVAEWEVQDMQKFILDKYKKITKKTSKEDLVKMLLDLRFRALAKV